MSREIVGHFVHNGRVVDNERQFNEAIALRIITARERKGWTKTKMAMTLGIAYETYRQYERRKKYPPYLVARIANILEEDISLLMTGERRARPPTPEQTPNPAKGGEGTSISTKKPAASKR